MRFGGRPVHRAARVACPRRGQCRCAGRSCAAGLRDHVRRPGDLGLRNVSAFGTVVFLPSGFASLRRSRNWRQRSRDPRFAGQDPSLVQAQVRHCREAWRACAQTRRGWLFSVLQPDSRVAARQHGAAVVACAPGDDAWRAAAGPRTQFVMHDRYMGFDTNRCVPRQGLPRCALGRATRIWPQSSRTGSRSQAGTCLRYRSCRPSRNVARARSAPRVARHDAGRQRLLARPHGVRRRLHRETCEQGRPPPVSDARYRAVPPGPPAPHASVPPAPRRVPMSGGKVRPMHRAEWAGTWS